jgi:hypothetical protein
MGNRFATRLAVLGLSLIMIPVDRLPLLIHQRVFARTTGPGAPRPRPKSSPIEYFHNQIRLRFYDLEVIEFGIARIPKRRETASAVLGSLFDLTDPKSVIKTHKRSSVDYFRPLTPDEQAAEDALRKSGWQVGFYLGGRGLLKTAEMTRAEWEEREQRGGNRYQHTITGPMLLEGQGESRDFPPPWELWEHGRKALFASKWTDFYKSSQGRWTIEARPVRADRQDCVDCHGSGRAFPEATREANRSALQVGDALGVVLYVYARRPDDLTSLDHPPKGSFR